MPGSPASRTISGSMRPGTPVVATTRVGLRLDALHVGYLNTLRAGPLVGERVRVRGEHPPCSSLHHQVGDAVDGCAEPDLADDLLVRA